MALDPSIALGVKQYQPESPVNLLGSMLQLQAAQRQNQLGAMQLAEHKAAAEERNALRQYLAGSPNLDAPDAQAGLYKVAPTQAAAILKGRLDLQKTQGEIGKTKAETDKYAAQTQGELLKQKQDRVNINLQRLGGINDPETAKAWVASGVKDGLISMEQATAEMAKIPTEPAQFAAWKQQQMQAGMSVSQQFDVALRQAAQAEAARHNAAGEKTAEGHLAVSRGQLGVAQGQLGLSRQRLAHEQANANSAVTYHQDANGNFVALPTKALAGQQVTAMPVADASGKPLQGNKGALNDSQAKAYGFGQRMQQADKILATLDTQYSPAGIATKNAVGRTPLIGGALEAGVNSVMSDQTQQAEQAQRDFVNAILRRESGAAISQGEFDNARKQYFPQPGDSDAVKSQKAANRKLAIQGVLSEVPQSFQSQPIAQPTGFKIIGVK